MTVDSCLALMNIHDQDSQGIADYPALSVVVGQSTTQGIPQQLCGPRQIVPRLRLIARESHPSWSAREIWFYILKFNGTFYKMAYWDLL